MEGRLATSPERSKEVLTQLSLRTFRDITYISSNEVVQKGEKMFQTTMEQKVLGNFYAIFLDQKI